MKIDFLSKPNKADVCVIGVLLNNDMTTSAQALDKSMKGALKHAMEHDKKFTGKRDQSLIIPAPEKSDYKKIILLGMGKAAELDEKNTENLGGTLYNILNGTGLSSAEIRVDTVKTAPLSAGDLSARLAYGLKLKSYRFDHYHTKKDDDEKPKLAKIHLVTDDFGVAKKTFNPLSKIADGVFLARDLVTEPPNVLYPDSYAKRIQKEMKSVGVSVDILDERKMAKLGMNTLLAVGMGSERPPRLVVMRYNGAPKSARNKQPLAFVGKGITFDTGGISLKPGAGMEDMKFDMGGSASVVGVMKALAGRKAKVNVIGVVALAENMPSGRATRPSDVVTSMSGQTVEIINTDAEGRLVLADALWYTQEKYDPRFVIDLATLTGAMIIALGHEFAGFFSNNDDLSEKLLAAGDMVEEETWRLPLCKAYDKTLKSPIADMRNISTGRGAGSATAAQFLQRFIKDDVAWAHIDIAGTAWRNTPRATVPKGATGYGVRLLDRLVSEYYE